MDRYQELESKIGNTPLVQYLGEIPNRNTIWIKRECDNLFGSHYDRVYLALFKYFEEQKGLKPGMNVLETTSGTAGASFTGIGRMLGYECHVAVPEGVDEAIIRVIKEQGATLYRTPEKDYVNGFPDFLRNFLPQHPLLYFFNHSMGTRSGAGFSNNEITLKAFESIAEEVLRETAVDIYLPAVGNGSTVLGPGRVFVQQGTQIVAFESVQAAVAYNQLYPNRYETRFGIKPGSLPRHRLRGTSYQGIDFPHIKHAVEQAVIDDVLLISDRWQDEYYHAVTGRNDFTSLPHWDQIFAGHEDVGRSTRAGIAACLELAKSVVGKTMLIIAYDNASRYDSESILG
ncbi:MAG: pyridoxal-phosphate dependent enzyme [Candidatus Woesearchaeota archaeon]